MITKRFGIKELSTCSVEFLKENAVIIDGLQECILNGGGGESYTGECQYYGEERWAELDPLVEVIVEITSEEVSAGFSSMGERTAEHVYSDVYFVLAETLKECKLRQSVERLASIVDKAVSDGYVGILTDEEAYIVSRRFYRPLLKFFSHDTIKRYCMEEQAKAPWFKGLRLPKRVFVHRGYTLDIMRYLSEYGDPVIEVEISNMCLGGYTGETELYQKCRERYSYTILTNIFIVPRYGEKITSTLDRALVKAGLV